MIVSLSARRAWIEIESVVFAGAQEIVSLSARRAWIEILGVLGWPAGRPVALRKESVDRNLQSLGLVFHWYASLSARRAWIEISFLT